MAKILVVDDEKAICDAFSNFLNRDGHQPLIASNSTDALNLVQAEHPDAIFLDVNLPGTDGIQTLINIKKIEPNIPVILMTAYGTMQTAITAMHEGAFDYLGKPVELQQVRKILERALHKPVTTEDQSSQQKLATNELPGTNKQLIGQSPIIQEVFKLMGLLTTNDLTVLITGESGVGKELVAHGIHMNSQQRNNPFIAVNCAAIPEHLIESELFGHEKGAFTGASDRRIGRFEAANTGTLFLDEIAELPLHLQSKLLRALQERTIERVGSVSSIPINARLIAATNRDLAKEVEQGRFRNDLYHRLKLVTLEVPPLRNRKEDIRTLAYHFLSNANTELGKRVERIEDAVLEKLSEYHWPGNVRELENTIKRAMLLCRSTTLTIHDLGTELDTVSTGENSQEISYANLELAIRAALNQLLTQPGQCDNLFDKLTAFTESTIIDEALRITNGNQLAASKLLSIHRSTMRKKISDGDEK